MAAQLDANNHKNEQNKGESEVIINDSHNINQKNNNDSSNSIDPSFNKSHQHVKKYLLLLHDCLAIKFVPDPAIACGGNTADFKNDRFVGPHCTGCADHQQSPVSKNGTIGESNRDDMSKATSARGVNSDPCLCVISERKSTCDTNNGQAWRTKMDQSVIGFFLYKVNDRG